jgi:protein O-mannosyl-transferase
LKTKKKNKEEIPVAVRKRTRIIYLLFLVFIPLVLYFRVVNFGLSELDDDTIISGINSTEGSKINLIGAFTHDAMMSNRGDSFYRPMQILSFMIDSEIGGGETWIYHVSNLILHILTVITLFNFLKKTGIKEEISFLLALLFSVNPVFTNAVAWIPARGDLLLCLFSLLSFISIIEYLKSGKMVYIIVHGIVFSMAMFSKETAVLLPVLILSYLYFVQRKKILLKKIILFLIIWSITFAVFFILRQSVLKINHTANEFGIFPFIKNLPTIPITLGKFFIPYNLCTLPSFDNTVAFIGIILIIVITLLAKGTQGDKKIYLWGALWFLAFSIPPMLFRSIDPNLGIEKYDYLDFRAYLPITGLLVVVGFILHERFTYISFKKMMMYFFPILTIYSYIAFNYYTAFSDSISFYTSAINANPDNIINLVVRGTIYYGQGNIHDAMLDFDNAIRLHPTYSLPYYNRGLIYETINDHHQAENSFSLALHYDTLYNENNFLQESSYLNLSSEKIILKKYDEAISILKKAISKYPDNSTIHFNLGVVYNYCGRFDSALYEFNKGIESANDSPEYFNNRGMVKDSLKDFAGAVADFSKALEQKQDYFEALKNRGMSKIRMNDNEGAIIDLTTLINIYPTAGELWYNRGLAYSKLNKTEKASQDLQQARKFGFIEP